MKALIVVDMQNDFCTGNLGTKEAQAIIPNIIEKIKSFDGIVLATRDTHYDNYLETQEGKNLPVPHCIAHTNGWEIVSEINILLEQNFIYNKISFGSINFPIFLSSMIDEINNFESIELCGVCTGICVLSNAAILKAAFPEIKIIVDSNACACVTPETHQNALNSLRMIQVEII